MKNGFWILILLFKSFQFQPRGTEFEFPDLFPADKRNKELETEQKQMQELDKQRDEFIARNKTKLNIPGWFS